MPRILALALLFAVAPALAQDAPPTEKFTIATGSTTGTYFTMVKQVAERCSTATMTIEALPTSGSVDNLSKLLGNEVEAALVQADVLAMKERTSPTSLKASVKTLMAFHHEEVHVVTLTESKLQEGGYGFGAYKVGKKTVVLNSFEELAGRRLGAVGGSVVSANLIRLQSEVSFQLVEYPSTERLLSALDTGEIAAALLVGGQPLGDVKALGPDHKILPFGQVTMDRLKNVYAPAKVEYPKMSPHSFPTVATDALLVTGDYRSARKVAALKALVTCIRENLLDFQETKGFHPKWRAVDPANPGKWDSRYEFPAAKATRKASR